MATDAFQNDIPDNHAEIFTEYQEVIRACRKCEEKRYLREARPVFSGHADMDLMILGQAPGLGSFETGIPWHGRGGDILRAWIAQAGFDPERFYEDWYLTSLTKCYPGKAKTGNGDRVPTRKEFRWCSPHLQRELIGVRPKIILTLGRLATEVMIPDSHKLRLDEIIGLTFSVNVGYGDVVVIPLPHPSGVSRWLNTAKNKELVAVALNRLGEERARLSL